MLQETYGVTSIVTVSEPPVSGVKGDSKDDVVDEEEEFVIDCVVIVRVEGFIDVDDDGSFTFADAAIRIISFFFEPPPTSQSFTFKICHAVHCSSSSLSMPLKNSSSTRSIGFKGEQKLGIDFPEDRRGLRPMEWRVL